MAGIKFCPWCGTEVEDDDARFCGVCGRPLGVDTQASDLSDGHAVEGRAATEGEGAGTHAGPAGVGADSVPPKKPWQGGAAADSGGSQSQGARPPRGRRRRTAVIAVLSVVVIAISLISIALTVTSGGGMAAPDEGGAAPSQGLESGDDNANQPQGQGEAAGNGASEGSSSEEANGSAPVEASGDTAPADANGVSDGSASGSGRQGGDSAADVSQASASAQAERDRVIDSMDGWWVRVGGRPYNGYAYYKNGTVFSYSHDGEPQGSSRLDVSVERVGPPEFGESGWKITANNSDPSQFVELNDANDMMWFCWYDDNGKLQYSGSSSVQRCGDGHSDPLPSFAASAQAAADQQASAQAAPTGFGAQMPTITGWEQQPLPWGASGFIWRASWTPIEGAEGYEVSRWDLDGGWVHQTQNVTTNWYDCSASSSEVFDVQVRAFKTEGGTRVYSQWSPQSMKWTSQR